MTITLTNKQHGMLCCIMWEAYLEYRPQLNPKGLKEMQSLRTSLCVDFTNTKRKPRK